MDFDPQNQDAYDDLLTAIEAGGQRLSLLIAVCDDSRLREAIIQRYEAELSPDWQCRQVTLAHDKPSIKTAITDAVSHDSTQPALVTVLGAEQLHFLKFDQAKSEQEEFLGYLQWTREALREFQFPIVLWLTNQLVAQVSKSAQDFWSWRKDVFRFSSKKTGGISKEGLDNLRDHLQGIELPEEDAFALPLKDLEAMIEHTSAKNPDDPLLATLYFKTGNVYFDRADSGEFQDYRQELRRAIDYYEQSIALQQKLDLQEDLAASKNQLARTYDRLGNYSEAEPLYQQALQLRQKLLGDEHPAVADSLNNLAELYKAQGRYNEAEPLYQLTLQLRQKFLGEAHPAVADSLNNLGVLYRLQGRYIEAEAFYLRCLEIDQAIYGDEHPNLATDLNNLAVLYKSQGRYSEAESLYQKALQLRRKFLGDDHPDVANSLTNLADLYESQGRYSESESLYQQALQLRQRLLGDDHPFVAVSLNNLATVYRSQRRYSEAESLYQQALQLSQQIFGNNHPAVAVSLSNLAGLYKLQRHYGKAESLYQQCFRIDKAVYGNDHPEIATDLNNLGMLYKSQGHLQKAGPLLVKALEMRDRLLGPQHPDTISTRKSLKNLRAAMNQ